YQELAEASEKMKNYKKAYQYQVLFFQIKDSIFNKESNKQIAAMQIRFETEKKEKENTLLIQKNQILQMQILQEKEKKRSQLIALIGSITFIIIIFILLYYRNKLKQKTKMEKE